MYLTSDGSKFLDEYIAVIHESGSQEIIEKDRRWKQMKTNISELVSKILKEKQWGIFFKNEPVQALPVQDSTTLYKVNEVKGDELTDAIEYAIEREIEWRNHQINLEFILDSYHEFKKDKEKFRKFLNKRVEELSKNRTSDNISNK